MAPPLNATFIHRQTLAGAGAFHHRPNWASWKRRSPAPPSARSASSWRSSSGWRRRVIAAGADDQSSAPRRWRVLDVASALGAARGRARLRAARRSTTASPSSIEGGRHPVVEQALSRDGTPFVANDCDLSPPPRDGRRPHLAAHRPEHGRQIDLPAAERADRDPGADGQLRAGEGARISASSTGCSRASAPPTISRAGARPSWSRWWRPPPSSTRPASASLVILDEIGRGTATFDGLSIAWATVEHLHDVNRCRALFATHFHELTALAARLARLHNATVRVKEWQGDVVFLHEVVPGAADRSYGIQVAKLAGLPASVIERARLVLAKLEQEDRAAPKGFEDLPLFAVPARPAPASRKPRARSAGRRRLPRSIPMTCRRARRWRRSTPEGTGREEGVS